LGIAGRPFINLRRIITRIASKPSWLFAAPLAAISARHSKITGADAGFCPRTPVEAGPGCVV
jgi:hypothetical protein